MSVPPPAARPAEGMAEPSRSGLTSPRSPRPGSPHRPGGGTAPATHATALTDPPPGGARAEAGRSVPGVDRGPDAPPAGVPEAAGAATEGGEPTAVGGAVPAPAPDWVDVGELARRHLPTIFTWVRNVGVVILLFVAWQLWGTSLAEHHAQDSLRSQFDTLVHAHPPTAGGPQSLLPVAAHPAIPPEGTVMAELHIAAIGMDQFVVSGTATADLEKGPGHYIGSAAPGQAGNVAIAGHRTTHGAPFNRLAELKAGDQIVLTDTQDRHFTYVVASAPFAVSPSDVAVLDNFGDDRITLTTCNPEFSASQRLIVVGKLLGQGTRVVLPPGATAPVPYRIVDGATASWRMALFPLVLVEVAVLVALGLGNRRLAAFYGRVGGWLILGPIWVAGLYLLFLTLTSFLPPSL